MCRFQNNQYKMCTMAGCNPYGFQAISMYFQFLTFTSVVHICTSIIGFFFIPRQAEVAQGVPGRLRPRIFLIFGTTRVVGHQPYAPAAFTPGEIPGTHFQRLSRPHGTWFRRWVPRKKSPVTPPGIDAGTVRPVAQCLNHYATPGPIIGF
jgi:hypothetical protein